MIPNIERLRDRLVETVFLGHYNETPQAIDLEQLTTELVRCMPSGVDRDAVFESVRYLAGIELSPAECLRLAWRMAGNLPRLREGIPVTPWNGQFGFEWVPLQILRCLESRDQKGRPGYDFDFRVMAGTPCPLRITTFWQPALLRMLSRNLGFSTRGGKYPYQKPSEMMGLRLLGKIDPQRSQGAPGFFDVLVPPNLRAWNMAEVLRYRMHVIPCPNNWTHPCRRCAVGYLNCRAGTHKEDYVERFCEICGKNSFFDPERGMLRCLTCDIKERRRV